MCLEKVHSAGKDVKHNVKQKIGYKVMIKKELPVMKEERRFFGLRKRMVPTGETELWYTPLYQAKSAPYCQAKSIGKVWVKDTVDITLEEFNGGKYYPAGFHIFMTKNAAEEYLHHNRYMSPMSSMVVVKVQFDNIVAVGTQRFTYRNGQAYEVKTIVAKDMLILREEIKVI